MRKLWQNNIDWTDQSDCKAKVHNSNLPLKSDLHNYTTLHNSIMQIAPFQATTKTNYF